MKIIRAFIRFFRRRNRNQQVINSTVAGNVTQIRNVNGDLSL